MDRQAGVTRDITSLNEMPHFLRHDKSGYTVLLAYSLGARGAISM